jgi:2'-5' RNA ligase
MARLFSAIVPSAEAVEHLAGTTAAIGGTDVPELAGLRWTPPERWHVTLGFFGDDDDPRRRSRWLTRRATGLVAPTLRLAGSGKFGRGRFGAVLWVGVAPATDADGAALARLARAAGAGRRNFRAHLTVGRWRTGVPDRSAADRSTASDRSTPRELFAGYAGPWFAPAEILLMESSGATYTPLLRLPLTAA